MAYTTKELEELALEAIEENEVARVSYLIPYLPISNSTFYNHGLDKLESIKDALFQQRINRKEKLINKWEHSDNATLSIAAFKLLADEQELAALNNSSDNGNGGNTTVVINKGVELPDD